MERRQFIVSYGADSSEPTSRANVQIFDGFQTEDGESSGHYCSPNVLARADEVVE
jgi:hypothetical protein